jgi:hypothetical protein
MNRDLPPQQFFKGIPRRRGIPNSPHDHLQPPLPKVSFAHPHGFKP